MPEQTIHDKVVTIVSALKTAIDGKADGTHTHSASDIVSGLATVATSGDYDDLSNKPTMPVVGTLDTTSSTAQSTNASESLSGSVTLHKVSKTGSYDDLSNKPTIPAAQVQTDWTATTGMGVLLNKPTFSTGLTESQGIVSVTRPVPASTSSDEGKVLGISNGSLGWVTPAVQQELRYSIADVQAGASVAINGNATVPYYLADRQVNVVTVDPSYTHVALVFPDGISGYARDFFVRLVLTGSDVPDITFVDTGLDAVDMDVDDDSWAEIDLGVNLLMFTETSQPASQGE